VLEEFSDACFDLFAIHWTQPDVGAFVPILHSEISKPSERNEAFGHLDPTVLE
jgi:hypothetical protein